MMRLTHVGGPTVLIEVDGWRILTDPTFDPPGRRYGFGWGTSSTKTAGPALRSDSLGPLDLVLLSHDHHADNLDVRGRELLTTADVVVTTRPGSRRLEIVGARGLEAGESTVLRGHGRPQLSVTATPCRHGPPLSRPIAGPVIGFALRLGTATGTRLWMTGDTVLNRRLRQTARELDVDVLLMHLGRVRFPVTGPLAYSMSSRDALELITLTQARLAVPVHYEGWSHFSEPESSLRSTMRDARGPVTFLERGRPWEVPEEVRAG